ncbi:MAG: hypothetical protein AAFW89_11915 [Bacteroidota bacterium]
MLFGLPWYAVVGLVAVVGSMILAFQQQKLELREKNSQNNQEIDELRKMVHTMKNRIENLEAIAATNPREFKSDSLGDIEIPQEDAIKEAHRRTVSNLAQQRG